MAPRLELFVAEPARPPLAHGLEGDVVRIGRAADNDVVLDAEPASRYHAELRRQEDGWIVVDLDSRNGTTVNGAPVQGRRAIRAGDEIAIAGVRLEVRHARERAGDARRDAPTADADHVIRDPTEPVLVGESEAMQAVRSTIGRLAGVDVAVLVTGESGTGKELVARLLHRMSPRAAGPLVVVNCPALPGSLLDAELFGVERGVATGVEARPGRLELAHGGTLFLDEVGELEPAAQARLLRFLQDGTVERVGGRSPVTVQVRVVSATNRDLEAGMAAGTFRRDLFHRIAAASIHLPPLRERSGDVALLAEHALAEGPLRGARLSDEALAALEAYAFPGNVRELRQVLLVAAASVGSDGVIRPEHLPAPRGARRQDSARQAPERLHARMLAGESFWDVVHGPFLRRELSREEVVRVLEHGRRQAGGSWKALVRLYGIEAEYRRFINFLAHHGLRSDAS